MRQNKTFLFLSAALVLSGCFATAPDFQEPRQPKNWTAHNAEKVKTAEAKQLEKWWERFNDQSLNNLVQLALVSSPQRLAAQERILEARGLQRAARSYLSPQIGASATRGRQDKELGSDSFYDAGFDASFEVDVFGKNRKNFSASKSRTKAAESGYDDVTLSLAAEVARSYIDLREAQNQARIARKNLKSQQKTLDLVKNLNRLGDAPKLDVDRAENLVNTTRASIPAYERAAENARMRLSVLTGMMPEMLSPFLQEKDAKSKDVKIPDASVAPVLMSPAKVLAQRPDIRAANANLAAATANAQAATAEFFPSFSLSGFFGVSDGALLNSATIWNVAGGAAVALLDFGRVEGRIDAARAVEKQAYQAYRQAILEAVVDVETALSDYSYTHEEYLAQKKAYSSAQSALGHSDNLFKQGEISFIDLLDAQRSLNAAEAAMVAAEAAKSKTLVRLFKSLGVY